MHVLMSARNFLSRLILLGAKTSLVSLAIALAVRLQPQDKTLTDADIEAVSAKVIEKVTKATGGSLRA